MDILDFLIQFVIFFIALVIFFFFKNYYPKYFETKGSNQATKEDIGAITSIVEEIKNELSQKTEFLKAQLSLSNQHKLSVKASEREAFFDYNKKLCARIYHLLRYSIYSYDYKDYDAMDDVYSEIDKRHLDVDIAEGHLLLFYRDESFSNLKGKLNSEILQLEQILTDYIFSLKPLYIDVHFAIKANPNKEKEIRETATEKRDEIMKDYQVKQVKKFGEIHSLHFDMMELIAERLEKIEEEIEELDDNESDS